jgi:hypothetical protein
MNTGLSEVFKSLESIDGISFYLLGEPAYLRGEEKNKKSSCFGKHNDLMNL